MKRVPIIVCGLGGVGKEFVRLLSERRLDIQEKFKLDLVLTGAVDIGGAAMNGPEGLDGHSMLDHVNSGNPIETFGEAGIPGMSGIDAIARSDAKVMVEATPTNLVDGGVGKAHVFAALENNMDVVSANKGPFVLFYDEVHALAAKNGCALQISAATAAALPTLDVGRVCLAGANLYSAEGILNGTTNYILSAMRNDGSSYEGALAAAQKMGIAESDPGYDVDGKDSANKIVLISNRLFGTLKTLSDVDISGITEVTIEDIQTATHEKKVIKLIACAKNINDTVHLSVGPKRLDENHPLASVNGSEKAITYETDTMGTLTVMGGKSSQVGAAAALLKDLINAYV